MGLRAHWIGRRRVPSRCHCRRRGVPVIHLSHNEGAEWLAACRPPTTQLQVVADLKAGAFRPRRVAREMIIHLPSGRHCRVAVQLGQAWHEVRSSLSRMLHCDRVAVEVEYQGGAVDLDAPVPLDAREATVRWRRMRQPERSRSRDRAPMVRPGRRQLPELQVPERAQEVGALAFYFEMPGGCWRLMLYEHELGCELYQLTASRAVQLLRWRYTDIFEQNRRYVMVAGRDVMRPEELLVPYMRQQMEFTADVGATVSATAADTSVPSTDAPA